MTLAFICAASLFPALLIVAALHDATTFTIPNWISLLAAGLYLPVALLAQAAPGVVFVSLACGGAALVAGVAMFAFGWIGGGDAKLFAACALWLGWPALLPFLFWTGVAGGGLAVGLLLSRKLAAGYPGVGPAWFGQLMRPGGDVPYGLAIATGALIAFPASALMRAAF